MHTLKFLTNNFFLMFLFFVFFKISFSFSQSGHFLWLDGSFWDFQIWTRGEPNHMYTSIEECAEMNWKGKNRKTLMGYSICFAKLFIPVML